MVRVKVQVQGAVAARDAAAVRPAASEPGLEGSVYVRPAARRCRINWEFLVSI